MLNNEPLRPNGLANLSIESAVAKINIFDINYKNFEAKTSKREFEFQFYCQKNTNNFLNIKNTTFKILDVLFLESFKPIKC